MYKRGSKKRLKDHAIDIVHFSITPYLRHEKYSKDFTYLTLKEWKKTKYDKIVNLGIYLIDLL